MTDTGTETVKCDVAVCEACGELWCERCLCHWAICGCPGEHDGDVIDCPRVERLKEARR